MLCEGFTDITAWCEALDVLNLHLLDNGQEVSVHQLHDWEEGAMAKWSVWSDSSPIVGH